MLVARVLVNVMITQSIAYTIWRCRWNFSRFHSTVILFLSHRVQNIFHNFVDLTELLTVNDWNVAVTLQMGLNVPRSNPSICWLRLFWWLVSKKTKEFTEHFYQLRKCDRLRKTSQLCVDQVIIESSTSPEVFNSDFMSTTIKYTIFIKPFKVSHCTKPFNIECLKISIN